MWELLFPIHQGMGHLLSTLGIIAIIWTIVLAWKEIEQHRVSSIFLTAFVGLVDLQIVLGLLRYYRAPLPNTWHPVLGILGAIALHAGNKMTAWKRVGSFVVGSICLVGAVILAV